MQAWARGVVHRLRRQGLPAEVREVEDGDAARVLFVREWAEGRETACLALDVDARGLRAGLELPPARVAAVREQVADPARALELSTALAALPEQFTLGMAGEDASAPPRPCTTERTMDDLRLLLETLERDPAVLWIGWSVPRDVALEHSALLDEQLEDAIVALVEVFALLAGDAGSEGAGARGAGGRATGRRRGTARDDDREPKKDRKKAATRSSRQRDRSAHARDREQDRDREREAEGEPEPDPLREAAPFRHLAHRAANGEGRGPRAVLRRRPVKAAAIARGARVSVLKGPFAGKTGVVQEVDGKGGARVMLGLLAVRIDVKNLVSAAEGRGRPRLSSSHRKPLPARS